LNNFYKFSKVLLINILVFFTLVIVIESFFGNWFNNKFAKRLSSERNIERIYKFDFSNHKGTSFYKRNNLGFRVPKKFVPLNNPDIVFVGGSTTNQKFLNYEETIVGSLQKRSKKLKILNAGIDGMSILGHINSFELWFDKIDDFNPKYYIFYIGINDQSNLQKNNKLNNVDLLIESSLKNNLKRYLKSNSFFYNSLKKLKTLLYLKTGNDLFLDIVNDGTIVYGERTKTSFEDYSKFENSDLKKLTNNHYESLLIKLTNAVKQRDSEIIYITQISGIGMNKKLFIIANTIISHCKDYKLRCVNLAKNANLKYNDFYDRAHLNRKGSKKVADFLSKEFLKLSIN
tara:strand:+ start:146 stop:1177 length:1032 start_codon:yes stop_codon:yes gene_type:complete